MIPDFDILFPEAWHRDVPVGIPPYWHQAPAVTLQEMHYTCFTPVLRMFTPVLHMST